MKKNCLKFLLFCLSMSLTPESISQASPNNETTLIEAFDHWLQQTIIPGNFNLLNPNKNSKVYQELFSFLYYNKDLTQEEIWKIPYVLQNRLEERERQFLKAEPKENCEATHSIQFITPETSLNISNSKTMIGFERGIAQVETTACLTGDTTQPLELIAGQAIWDPQFRLRALKYTENVWTDPIDRNRLCEKLNFKFGFFNIGTSNYCIEAQSFNYRNVLFMKIWIVSNKLKVDGVTLPVFFNEQLISLQRTRTGLLMHFNTYIRGLGGENVPKQILKSLLTDQQNEFIKQLEIELQKK